RYPNVSRRSESEFLTRDADHGPQLAAKPDGAADNSAISSKAPLPKRVAEHNSVGSARAIFVLRKAAAEHGLYPQSAEKVRTDTEGMRSEEHTSELQSRGHLVCRLLLEKKKTSR